LLQLFPFGTLLLYPQTTIKEGNVSWLVRGQKLYKTIVFLFLNKIFNGLYYSVIKQLTLNLIKFKKSLASLVPLSPFGGRGKLLGIVRVWSIKELNKYNLELSLFTFSSLKLIFKKL
jgi:hypothetical protein